MKAVSRATGEWFAVKMIHDNKMNNNSAAANGNSPASSFAREISILEKLKHPNICQLKEVFFQDGNISPSLLSLLHTR
jgi:serine/threonine/tyrosine protein kinase RAD53